MEIFGSMLRVLSEKVVSIGIELLKETEEFKNTRKVLRQRLLREVTFNHEIIPNLGNPDSVFFDRSPIPKSLGF